MLLVELFSDKNKVNKLVVRNLIVRNTWVQLPLRPPNMRFVVLYRNEKHIRDFVEISLIDILKKGVNLEQVTVQHPQFQTRKSWPNLSELMQLPLWLQCEELLYENDHLTSLRQQVIDIVMEVIRSKETKNESPSDEIKEPKNEEAPIATSS